MAVKDHQEGGRGAQCHHTDSGIITLVFLVCYGARFWKLSTSCLSL
jgi:hypothetical protein